MTGNYTVLRDLGASILQSTDTAADLAAQFAEFRQKHISLAPTVLFDAILDDKPKLTADGTLRLIGHFPTAPQEVVFDLTYRFEDDSWRIARISVGTRTPTKTNAIAAPKSGSSASPQRTRANP